MSTNYNPSSVTTGLIMYLDASNPKSYNPAENLLTYSEDTSNYQYIENASVTTNTITSPDNTVTADTLTSSVTGGSNTCLVQKYLAVSANTQTYTFSVFLRAGTSPTTTINMQLAGGTYQQSVATITWSSNTITSSSGGTSYITSYGNGWYRVGITLTNNGTNNAAYPRVYVKDQGTSNVSGQTVYVWGWQLETGGYMNTYTPVTTTSTITRSTTWTDLTGNGYNATLSNTYFVSSESGGVFETQGVSGSYISQSTLNLSSTNYTVITATRYAAASPRGRMLNGRSNNWLLGNWSGTTENYYAEGWVSAVSAGTADTTWRILAGTGHITGDVYSMYINGTNNILNNTGGSQGPYGITVGVNGYSPTTELSLGRCSFVMAYNRVLSATEINQNFNALRGRFGI